MGEWLGLRVWGWGPDQLTRPGPAPRTLLVAVPFRQSKLTSVLKDSLGGNCRTLMFACIWGERAHLEETVSTLKFAARMMRVRNEAHANVRMDPALLARKYEQRIREVRGSWGRRWVGECGAVWPPPFRPHLTHSYLHTAQDGADDA